MFGLIYYLLNHKHTPSHSEPLVPDDETILRKRKILTYLSTHPYSTMGEISRGINEDHRLTSGTVMGLFTKGQINREKDEECGYRYFIF